MDLVALITSLIEPEIDVDEMIDASHAQKRKLKSERIANRILSGLEKQTLTISEDWKPTTPEWAIPLHKNLLVVQEPGFRTLMHMNDSRQWETYYSIDTKSKPSFWMNLPKLPRKYG